MIFQIFISALLLYLAFPNIYSLQGFPILSGIFAVPLFFSLKGKNWLSRLAIGFIFGVIANLALVNWMIPYSFPGYLLLSLVLASQAMIFAVLYRPVLNRDIINIFYVAAMWVVSEYVRKVLMFGESWDLAHSQSFDTALMQISGVFGSAAVSFLLMTINYAIYCLVQKFKISMLVTTVVLLLLAYGYGFMRLAIPGSPTKESPRIFLLQTTHDYHGDISSARVYAILDDNVHLTRQAIIEFGKPDLIVWPETAIPMDFLHDAALREKVVRFVDDVGTNVLIGGAIKDKAGQHNSAVLFNARGEVAQVYHKRHLIPLTEFIPETIFWKIFAKIFRVETPDLVEGKASEAGMMQIILPNKKQIRFGVAICSEDNIDSLFREYSRKGAQFVVVLLNNGWFTQPAGYVMHAQHSIVRAAENRLSVFRSSNQGWSGWINESGGTRKESLDSLGQRKVFYYEMTSGREKSSFNNLGDTFCFLCISFVILMKFSTIKDR